ncbi:MAG TPA: hypothetical protein DIW31_00590 [Bacteroidales bacterium]|nr:hypothetical protein [Bacteroidales bacterium]
MKNIVLKFVLISILLPCGYFYIKGQENNSNIDSENVSLFTDRTLYISGERIQFAAYLFLKNNNNLSNPNDNIDTEEWRNGLKNQNLSKILNIELITPDGVKISEGKYFVDNSFCSGYLKIPDEVETGPYYIRAYTKFMRNNGPSSYCYLYLKIINPIKSDVLKYTYTKRDTIGTQIIAPFSLNKEIYSTREQVVIPLKDLNFPDSRLLKGMNLTVIPESTFISKTNIEPLAENNQSDKLFYPESSGLSLTGQLKDSKTEKLLPNYTVNLSILGDCKDFMAVKTDTTGHFYFKMPYLKGVKNIFLCTESVVDSKSSILIDNDFCQNKVRIPTTRFHLSDSEKKAALDLALNHQISSHFNKIDSTDSTKYSNNAFYGKPQVVLDLNNYIDLPTIEDYIFELVPMLKVKKKNGKKFFKIISVQGEMNIYEPLVLLDLVAIDDPDKILAISPRKISRFEIIYSPYIKGNVIYGGIISIFSKKNDFANIDLSSSGVFLDFNFLKDNIPTYKNRTISENLPDTRNTLLWVPNLVNSKTKEISFTTSDTPGKYIVLIRGITNRGKEFVFQGSFEVKEQQTNP